MGLFKKFLGVSAIGFLTLFFAPGLPPHDIRFEPFTLLPALPLQGKLAPNNILDLAEEIKVDREFRGPESVAIRGDEIFTGLDGGELIRINVKNGKSKSYGRMVPSKPCEGLWDHINCGRIAGLRFGPDGKLYVADVVNGIFRIDVDTEKVENVVPLDVPIDGKLPRFPDDLDIGKDGAIYWSDASTVGDVQNILMEFLGSPTGRLIRTDPKTKQSQVLIENVHFANGIQLSESEDFILVSETVRARVLRYYLKGEKKGENNVFVDQLPGLPDNLRPNGKGGYYIVMSAPRIDSELSLIDVIGPRPLVRRFICRMIYMIIESMKFVESLFPSVLLREWIAYAQHLGPLADLEKLPYKTIIVETDGNGRVTGSLQNEKGPVTRLSEIRLDGDYAYLGSPSLKTLYRIQRKFLP